MAFFRSLLVVLLAVLVCAGPAAAWAKDKEKEAKPKVSVLLKEANRLMEQAQAAYVDGKSSEAIEGYRKALAEIDRVERENAEMIASSEFAPVRFRRALCETEIDRILLEDVNAKARTVAVTDTAELEAKRAERKRAAETNNQATVSKDLAQKTRAGNSDPAAEASADEPPAAPVADAKPAVTPEKNPEPASAPAPAPEKKSEKPAAASGKPVDVAQELEWAKDMVSVDRFEEAEKALIAVLKQTPENRDARFLMALCLVRQEHFSDAAVIVEDLLADYPKDEAVLLLSAGCHAGNGRYAQAVDLLDRAMKLNPERPEGYLDMAWLLIEMNAKETTEAEMYYRQAVKLGAARDRDLEKRLGIKTE